MIHPTAHGGVLYSSLVENAALTTLVFVAELSLDNICDNLILSMRMQRPYGAGAQRIIVQDAEVSETIVQGTIVRVEGKMPATTKRSILDPA
jgi:hypothetical protein